MSLCFGCPSAQFVIQRDGFCTMHVIVFCKLINDFSHVIYSFTGYDSQKNVHFDNEGEDDALRMLKLNEFRRVSLRWFWFYCRVDEYQSWYIGCNGSEVPQRSRLFTIHRGPNHNFPYFVKVRQSPCSIHTLYMYF